MAAAERYQHYEVLRREDGTLWELGRGSMGITYKAYDTSLRCPVALKVINSTYLESDVARQRFLREARAAAALRHQNVASVFHLGTDNNSYFYAMEFIDGETVEAYMKRKGVLQPVEALGITLQVCRALAAAAKQELVHRDLKPANLMLVDEEGEKVVKVIDFGLAKSSKPEGEESGTLTMGGGFVGTPHFASPEQLEEADIDIRSDIYSLGATLYYMLTGHPPFSGSVAQIMSQHLYRPLPLEPLQQFPPALLNLIVRMMDKDRNKRPQTPADLRQEITQCLADLHVTPELLEKEEHRSSAVPALVSPVEPTALAPGAILARRYAITREMEEILQGRRFAANDLQRTRLVSVLVFNHEFVADSKRYTALEKEVDQLRRASLPGLRAVYSLESAPEGSFLVEEYVSGRQLLEIMRVRQILSPAETLLLLNLLAPVADYARANRLQQVDLTLQGIQLTSGTIGASELSQQPLTEWSQLGVKVAAVDFSYSSPDSATWGGTATLTRSGPQEGPRASYLGMLSMLLYEMLGGPRSLFEGHGRYTPISILSEEGNAVLRRAMIDDLSSAAELVNQLGPHLQARGPTPARPNRFIADVRPPTSSTLQRKASESSTPIDQPPVLPSTVVPETGPPKAPKKTGLIRAGILIFFVIGLMLGGYALYDNFIKKHETGQATPAPTPVLTPTSTPLQVVTLSPTPLQVVTPSPTPLQLVTPEPTPVQVVTPSPTPLQLVTPAPTPVQPVTPSPTPLQLVTPAPTPVQPVTPSPTPLQVVTPSPTPVQLVTPAPTPVQLATPTSTPLQVVTPTPKPVRSATPTRLPVQLLTPPPTPVQLSTPEPTPVVTTPTPRQTSTPTQIPENSPTPVLTPSPAESVITTPQPSPTQIAMLSPTPPLIDRYHELLSKAQTEEVNNDWRTALKTYLYVMDEFPNRPGGSKRLDNLISGLRSPGRGVSAEALADARADFEDAANRGIVPAMLILAEQLRSTDKAAALKWYEAAAEKDNVTGMVQAGILYAAERDPDALHKAVDYFIQAGDKGDRMGKYLAGECYYYGKGVPADTKKAVAYLQESAALGEPRAMDLLGTYYRKVAHQYDQARHYFEEAAGLGYATSISNLGVMYMNGEGVAKNPQTGAGYFRQAAEKGDAAGMFFYAECLHAGLGVPKNQKEAADWYRRSAKTGFGPAVGWCKQNGLEY